MIYFINGQVLTDSVALVLHSPMSIAKKCRPLWLG